MRRVLILKQADYLSGPKQFLSCARISLSYPGCGKISCGQIPGKIK